MFKKIIIFFLLIIIFAFPAFGAARPSSDNHSWIWNVLVIPPDEGWNSEAGRTIQAALKWEEDEISDSGTGVAGHDLKFIYLDMTPPREESTLINDINNLNNDNEIRAVDREEAANNLRIETNERTMAIISFAGTETNRVLVSRLGGNTILPLFLANAEDVLIERNERPIANVFALDLYRDYRTQAFALYAAHSLKKDAKVALVASRFTENQEREAKLSYRFFEMQNFVPMPFWLDASVRDAFNMVAQEIESATDGVVITFLGGMGAREMWRNFMRVRTTWRIWNCSNPDNMYLSYRGMTFADQNFFLNEHGGFYALRRNLWSTRAVQVSDNVTAGRAHAIVEWLKRGILTLSQPQPLDFININRAALLNVLANIRGIPFGNQQLDVNFITHRPRSRNVFICDVQNRAYRLLDTVNIQSMPYIAEP